MVFSSIYFKYHCVAIYFPILHLNPLPLFSIHQFNISHVLNQSFVVGIMCDIIHKGALGLRETGSLNLCMITQKQIPLRSMWFMVFLCNCAQDCSTGNLTNHRPNDQQNQMLACWHIWLECEARIWSTWVQNLILACTLLGDLGPVSNSVNSLSCYEDKIGKGQLYISPWNQIKGG